MQHEYPYITVLNNFTVRIPLQLTAIYWRVPVNTCRYKQTPFKYYDKSYKAVGIQKKKVSL